MDVTVVQDVMRMDEVKRKIRRLRRLEAQIRFGGAQRPAADLMWGRFFDLSQDGQSRAKYKLLDLASMNRERFKQAVDEYMAFVYYEYYRENGLNLAPGLFDPALLGKLNLKPNATEQDIKRRFRELAMLYHPDTGGDAARFVALMEDYRALIKKG